MRPFLDLVKQMYANTRQVVEQEFGKPPPVRLCNNSAVVNACSDLEFLTSIGGRCCERCVSWNPIPIRGSSASEPATVQHSYPTRHCYSLGRVHATRQGWCCSSSSFGPGVILHTDHFTARSVLAQGVDRMSHRGGIDIPKLQDVDAYGDAGFLSAGHGCTWW